MTNIDVTLPKHAVDGPQHATHETDTAKVLRPDGNGGVRWASAAGGGDMYKSTYDTDDDGVVDNAEQLGGVAAADYLTEAEHTAIGDAAPHHARYTDVEAVAAILAADGPGSGLDADTLDGQHYADISNEIDGDISTHAGVSDAHHSRYTDGEAVAAVLAADGPGSGLDADTVDGQHYTDISSEIDGDISTHAGVSDAHHARYTDAEAVAAVPQATTATQGKAELATESEMDTGTDTERIITPALLRTRELDIAELIFTEDDGLLLLGPGCPMTPDSWISLRGQEAAISGAFHQVAGRWPQTLALTIERATTNLFTNPSMETGSSVPTGYAEWWPSNVVASKSAEETRFGHYSAKCITDGSRAAGIYDDVTVTHGHIYTFSAYVKAPPGTTIHYGCDRGWMGDSVHTATGGWDRVVAVGTADTSTYSYGRFYVASPDATTFYTDGWQLEAVSVETSYCDGSLGSGYSWSGIPHSSTSSRPQTRVDVDGDHGISESTGSIAIWVRGERQGYWSDTDARYFWGIGGSHNVANTCVLWMYNSYLYIAWNGTQNQCLWYLSSAPNDGWHHIVVTWEQSTTTLKLYFDGELKNADTSIPTIASWASDVLQIGGRELGSYEAEASFSELSVFDRVLTLSEISALYAAGKPLVDESPNIASPVDNLGPLAGAWPILFGSQTHTGDTSYSEAGSNQESRFGWGTWVSGSLQFEAVIKISDSGDTGYAMLQWNDSGTWRDVEGSEVSITGSTSADLVRSGVIYLSPDEREYRVVIKTSDSSQTITIYKAALICTPGGLSAI